MKKLHKKLLISSISLLVFAVVIIIITDSVIMPNYVYAPELEVPEMVGMNQEDAIALLKEMKLMPSKTTNEKPVKKFVKKLKI